MSTLNARPGAALAGWYVILCRPRGENASMARRARALGAETLSLPVFRIVAADDPQRARDALAEALRCAQLIFTSPAAVRQAARLLPGWQASNASALAVGKGTAAALTECGWQGEVVLPERPNSESVLELPQLRRAPCVGLVTAPDGRGLIDTKLQTRGVRLVRAEVYRREQVTLALASLKRLDRAQGRLALLASSEQAVARLLQLLPESLRQKLLAGTVVVSSKRLQNALTGRGFGHVVLAEGPGPSELLSALAGFAATASSCSITRAAHARFE